MKKYKITLRFKKGNGKDIIAKEGIVSINELELHYEAEDRTKAIVEKQIIKDMLKFEWEMIDEDILERKS